MLTPAISQRIVGNVQGIDIFIIPWVAAGIVELWKQKKQNKKDLYLSGSDDYSKNLKLHSGINTANPSKCKQ